MNKTDTHIHNDLIISAMTRTRPDTTETNMDTAQCGRHRMRLVIMDSGYNIASQRSILTTKDTIEMYQVSSKI